jgi:hypothetical protein
MELPKDHQPSSPKMRFPVRLAFRPLLASGRVDWPPGRPCQRAQDRVPTPVKFEVPVASTTLSNSA